MHFAESCVRTNPRWRVSLNENRSSILLRTFLRLARTVRRSQPVGGAHSRHPRPVSLIFDLETHDRAKEARIRKRRRLNRFILKAMTQDNAKSTYGAARRARDAPW
jgi:hypothetical protein